MTLLAGQVLVQDSLQVSLDVKTLGPRADRRRSRRRILDDHLVPVVQENVAPMLRVARSKIQITWIRREFALELPCGLGDPMELRGSRATLRRAVPPVPPP